MKTVTSRQILERVSGGSGVTLAEVGAVSATGTSLGAGYGASSVIAATPGGFHALELGMRIPVGGAAAAGLIASAAAGYAVGTVIYNNSTAVRNGADAAVSGIMDGGKAIGRSLDRVWVKMSGGEWDENRADVWVDWE